MAKFIKTERLVLRPWVMADAAPCADLLGDFEVTRWLSVVPHPYVLNDAVTYIRDSDPTNRFCIEIEGKVAGGVGISDSLGYWLGQPFWGQGYMSEAAPAVVAAWFSAGHDNLTSGYFTGNARSAAILKRLGFVKTEMVQEHCRAQGTKLPMQRMALDQEEWLARND